MLYMKNIDKAMLGFVSPKDFFVTIFGLKSAIVNTWFAFICFFTSLVTNYVWDSPDAIFTLLVLMFADWGTGLFLAIRAKIQYDRYIGEGIAAKLFGKIALTEPEIEYYKRRYFRSTRFPRMIVSMIISLSLLSLSWNLSKANSLYYFAPSFAYGGVTGTYFISLIENSAEWGIISKDVVSLIKDKLNPVNWFK
jgi:hypothetical protein